MTATILQFPAIFRKRVERIDQRPEIRIWYDRKACGFGGFVVEPYYIPDLAFCREEFFEHEQAVACARLWAAEFDWRCTLVGDDVDTALRAGRLGEAS